MSDRLASTRYYPWLIIISLAVHLLIFLLWAYLSKHEDPIANSQTITVSLAPEAKEQKKGLPEEEPNKTHAPNPEPEPEQPKKVKEVPDSDAHMPMHNAEQNASDNNEDRTITELQTGKPGATEAAQHTQLADSADNNTSGAASKGKQADEPVEPSQKVSETAQRSEIEDKVSKKTKTLPDFRKVVSVADLDMESSITDEQLEAAVNSQQALAEAMSQSDISESLGIAWQRGESEKNEFNNQLNDNGNALLLSETELRSQVVKNPFSERKSKELEMANRYLQRMSKQVFAQWVNPYKEAKVLRGIIHFEVDAFGYLVNARILRTSGNRILDISVLDAIKAVRRYEVPEDPTIVAKYYSNLRFHFSSRVELNELMPFERE